MLPYANLSCASFSTNNDNNLCNINTRCHDPSCSRGTVGRLIPGEAYANDEKITWVIAGPPGALIVLTFTEMNTEDIYDPVVVYSCSNATCADPVQLLSKFGTVRPAPVTSNTSAMMVVWNGMDHCCPTPSAICSCDNAANAAILTGWTAEFSVITEAACAPPRQQHARATSGAPAQGFRPLAGGLSVHADLDAEVPVETYISDTPLSRETAESRLVGYGAGFSADDRGDRRMDGLNARTRGDETRPASVPAEHYVPSWMRERAPREGERRPRAPYGDLAPHRVRAAAGPALSMCGERNSAVYGACIASTYKGLRVVPQASPVYPGVPFPVTVLKTDAYNQTVLTDSSSVLQVYAVGADAQGAGAPGESERLAILGPTIVRMQRGAAEFQIAVKPAFALVSAAARATRLAHPPAVFFTGSDAGPPGASAATVQMQSPAFTL